MTSMRSAGKGEGDVQGARPSLEQLRAIVGGLDDLAIEIGESGTVLWASPSARAWLQTDPAEMVGRPGEEFLPIQGRRWQERLTALAGGHASFAPRPVEFRVGGRRRSGEMSLQTFDLGPVENVTHQSRHGILARVRDVSLTNDDAVELSRSEAWFQTLLSAVTDVVVVLSLDGHARYANHAANTAFGIVEGMAPLDLLARVDPDHRSFLASVQRWLRTDEQAMAGRSSPPLLVRMKNQAGTLCTWEVRIRKLLAAGETEGYLVTSRDVTDQHQSAMMAHQSAELLEAVARGAPLSETLPELMRIAKSVLPGIHVALGMVDMEGTLRALPGSDFAAAFEQFGDDERSTAALYALSNGQLPYVHRGADVAPNWAQLAGPIAEGGVRAYWVWSLRDEDGSIIGSLLVLVPDERGPTPSERLAFAHVVNLAGVVIQRHRAVEALAHQARRDPLTGLPNRRALLELIERRLADDASGTDHLALLFCDLDRFKAVNDALGHSAGDRLLVAVANRWRDIVQEPGIIGRFGGDEFLVVIAGDGEGRRAVEVAEQLIAALVPPFDLDGERVTIGASIGVARANPATSAHAGHVVVGEADAAMYRAKGLGRNRYALADHPPQRDALDRLQLEAALRQAIPRDELVLHFQPIIRSSDGAVEILEALVRWDRPGRGLVPPSDFVAVAEDTGLILPLGSWTLRAVVRQLQAWSRDPVLGRLIVTLNVSARQMAEPGLVSEVAQVLAEHDVDPGHLAVEITESVLMEDPALVIDAAERLTTMGVFVVIDDIGAGFTSFDLVRRFGSVAALKIDQSIVSDIVDPASRSRPVVSAIVALAEGLGAAAVAEGLERDEQVSVLRDLGCYHLQGFLFGRPVPANEVANAVEAVKERFSGTTVS